LGSGILLCAFVGTREAMMVRFRAGTYLYSNYRIGSGYLTGSSSAV
jgi:hypothetical protein